MSREYIAFKAHPPETLGLCAGPEAQLHQYEVPGSLSTSWGCSDGAQLLSEVPLYPVILACSGRRVRESQSPSVHSEQFIMVWT